MEWAAAKKQFMFPGDTTFLGCSFTTEEACPLAGVTCVHVDIALAPSITAVLPAPGILVAQVLCSSGMLHGVPTHTHRVQK